MLLGQFKNELFGLGKRAGHILLGVLISQRGNFTSGMNEPAQDGAALHNAAVVFNVAARGNPVNERGNITRAANVLQLALALQVIANRNEICRRPGTAHAQHRFVDQAIGSSTAGSIIIDPKTPVSASIFCGSNFSISSLLLDTFLDEWAERG